MSNLFFQASNVVVSLHSVVSVAAAFEVPFDLLQLLRISYHHARRVREKYFSVAFDVESNSRISDNSF